MDYGTLLKDAAGRIRHTPSLLWLGLLTAVSLESFAILGRFAFGDLASLQDIDLPGLMRTIQLRLLDTRWMITAVLLLTGLLLLVWLVTTVAAGGLIIGVDHAERGHPLSFPMAIRKGIDLLWRFVVIDTVLFFPLFLLSLLILIIGSGGLISAALALNNGGSMPDAFAHLGGVGLLCVLPLSCLTLPVGIGTFLYRALVFRTAALENLGKRASLRRAWQQLKTHFTPLLLVGLLVVAVRSAVQLVRLVLGLPLGALTLLPIPGALLLTSIASALIAITLTTLLQTYISAVWTLAYRRLFLEGIRDKG